MPAAQPGCPRRCSMPRVSRENTIGQTTSYAAAVNACRSVRSAAATTAASRPSRASSRSLARASPGGREAVPRGTAAAADRET
ncbi:hypothetical protein [Actinoplanes sp. ATCC 53533]|uniref:hypothetical protein n=1 Tax=Actinoplanes sp. ATCC 53533 TaxID=1288362 RepID=UPI0018F5F135|nr:hypothetical protein [Actinoplanes sp. ATCC 53533]